MKVDSINSVSQKIANLKSDISSSILNGQYNKARESHKELAKIAMDNFELTVKTPEPSSHSFSLFSKKGFNALLFTILEKFRKKTPEEKRLIEFTKMYNKGVLKF